MFRISIQLKNCLIKHDNYGRMESTRLVHFYDNSNKRSIKIYCRSNLRYKTELAFGNRVLRFSEAVFGLLSKLSTSRSEKILNGLSEKSVFCSTMNYYSNSMNNIVQV